jgi:hypothetical protein
VRWGDIREAIRNSILKSDEQGRFRSLQILYELKLLMCSSTIPCKCLAYYLGADFFRRWKDGRTGGGRIGEADAVLTNNVNIS